MASRPIQLGVPSPANAVVARRDAAGEGCVDFAALLGQAVPTTPTPPSRLPVADAAMLPVIVAVGAWNGALRDDMGEASDASRTVSACPPHDAMATSMSSMASPDRPAALALTLDIVLASAASPPDPASRVEGAIEIVPSAADVPAISPETSPVTSIAPASDRLIGTLGQRVLALELPWHLTANAGLSYRASVSCAESREDQPCTGSAMPRPLDPMPVAEPGARAARHLPWVEFADDEIRTSAELDRRPTAPLSSASTPQDRAMALVGTWQPMPSWPQRLLRWTEDGDGGTAWVRDFNLAPEQYGSVVALLHELALAQGRMLRRVMLNGHVLWQSPSPR